MQSILHNELAIVTSTLSKTLYFGLLNEQLIFATWFSFQVPSQASFLLLLSLFFSFVSLLLRAKSRLPFFIFHFFFHSFFFLCRASPVIVFLFFLSIFLLTNTPFVIIFLVAYFLGHHWACCGESNALYASLFYIFVSKCVLHLSVVYKWSYVYSAWAFFSFFGLVDIWVWSWNCWLMRNW